MVLCINRSRVTTPADYNSDPLGYHSVIRWPIRPTVVDRARARTQCSMDGSKAVGDMKNIWKCLPM